MRKAYKLRKAINSLRTTLKVSRNGRVTQAIEIYK